MNFSIRKHERFDMFEHERDEWIDYWCTDGKTKYKKILADFVSLLLLKIIVCADIFVAEPMMNLQFTCMT